MKTRFFAFAALALTLAACNNDNENLNDGPVAAQFIADITPATRVNSEGTDWTDGDRIGVTGAGFTNVPYKRENGKFVTDGGKLLIASFKHCISSRESISSIGVCISGKEKF